MDHQSASGGGRTELVLNDHNLDLIEEGIDVAVRIGQLSDSNLVVKRVGEVRRVLVASPAYLKRRGTPKKPAALAAHDIIVGIARSEPSEWRFGPPRVPTIVRLSPRLVVNETEARLVAARAGQGIMRVLSYQLSEDLRSGSLISMIADHEAVSCEARSSSASDTGTRRKSLSGLLRLFVSRH